jgi:hypothetical protein
MGWKTKRSAPWKHPQIWNESWVMGNPPKTHINNGLNITACQKTAFLLIHPLFTCRWNHSDHCLVESLVKAVDAHVPSISLLVTLRQGPAMAQPTGIHNMPQRTMGSGYAQFIPVL